MDEVQYRVDNIDIAHPNIYITSYRCPLYHINYLPYHVAELFTGYTLSQPSAMDYLPLNCNKIRTALSFRRRVRFALYNLPPLIAHVIIWPHHKKGRWYKHNLFHHYMESITTFITPDYCDIINKNNICAMQSYCMQNAIYIN
jgi:hypothetical protein